MSPNFSRGNRLRQFCSEIMRMKVEVVMFLYTFSYTVRSITATSMIIDKVCLVHLGKPEEICQNLADYPTLKTAVEKMANNYHLGHTLLQVLPSTVLSIFVGAWSDKYGRKVPVASAIAGIAMDGLGATLCAYFMNSRLEYYFIAAIFTNTFGGVITIRTVLYSYASDVSTAGNRTMKYAFLEMAFGLSIPLGSLTGGWIYNFYGYTAVFMTSTCGHIIAFCWVIFILEETRGLDNRDNWMTKFRSFWSLESLASGFRATIKKRPNRGREQIWWLILAMSITVFSVASTASTAFLFVYHQFNWGNTTFSTVAAIFSVLSVIAMLVIVPLSKKFNVGDPCLGIVGCISLLLKNVGTGLSYHKEVYFLANAAGLIASLESLAGRSRISKIVSKEDLGKVFSFVTTAEFMLPIFAAAVISQAFNASLDFFPGLIFVVMGSLIVIPIGVFIWLSRLPVENYEKMDEDVKEMESQYG